MRYYNEINDISAINLKYGQSLYNNSNFLFFTFIILYRLTLISNDNKCLYSTLFQSSYYMLQKPMLIKILHYLAVSLSVDTLSMWQNEWSLAINFDHDTFTFLLSYTIKIFVSCLTSNGHLWFMIRIIVFIFIFAWSYLHVWLWLCYCSSLLNFSN